MPAVFASIIKRPSALPGTIARAAPFLLCALLLLSAGMPACAQSELADRIRVLLDDQAPAGGEIEVTVGEPDSRLSLAPCARYEPFIPSGAKLIGRTSIGVRCVEGANWTIYLPVQIRLFMNALVTARPIARGHAVSVEDFRIERIDVAALRGNFVPPGDAIEGRVAARSLAPGEPLRRDLLRTPPIMQPGDAVQVIAYGTGFAAQMTGRALTAASEGQAAQVALPNGKTLVGTARANGIVEVR
jgi:flagella basal body P-ring formation protein FlgA